MTEAAKIFSDDWAFVTTDDQDNIEPSAPTADRGLLEYLADLPVPEDIPIEFPQLPEIANMGAEGPDFFERLIPNVKIIMTRDDAGKAEVIKNSWEGDPRFGGVYSDKFNLPIIIWQGQPYYVNKPGMSMTDAGTFIGEIAKYAPAGRFVTKAQGILSTIGRGSAAYSTTEIADKALQSQIAPENAARKSLSQMGEEISEATATNVAADVLLPPFLDAGSRLIKSGVRTISEGAGEFADRTFPAFNLDDEIIQESKYPLTRGQQTAELPRGVTPRQNDQLGREDELRQTASSSQGTSIVRGFDDNQLLEIKKDAEILMDEFGTGSVDDVIDAGIKIRGTVSPTRQHCTMPQKQEM